MPTNSFKQNLNSASKVAQALENNGCINPNQHDHSYSLASLETNSHSNGILELPTARRETVQLNTSDSPSPCSSDLFSESEDDSDASPDGNNYNSNMNGESARYPLNIDEIDGLTAPNTEVGRTNFIITNGRNTPNQQDSGISVDSFNIPQQLNGMDADNEANSGSEKTDEGDEDMAFLYEIQKELDQSANGLSANCDSDGKVWQSIRIFDDVCLKYLRDECYNTYCDYKHTLPPPKTVESRLDNASRREINEAQNHILLRYDMLMSEFFTVFCTHYGRKWQMHRENLRQMILVLSKKPKAADYMLNILNGFHISGMKYSTCVDQLLLEMDGSLEDQFSILWQLIIDPRNDKINEHLKAFETVLLSDAIIIADAINKILNYQTSDELADLRDYAVNLVKKCRITIFRRIDLTLLESYISYVKSFDQKASQAIQQRAAQFGLFLDN